MNLDVYIIAGPNGAGKTTFAREFLPNHADCKNFINADLIAQGVPPFSPSSAAFRAGRLMLAEIERYTSRGESCGFETRLSGRSYVSFEPGFWKEVMTYPKLWSADAWIARSAIFFCGIARLGNLDVV